MVIDVVENPVNISNRAFKDHIALYQAIQQDFHREVSQFGLEWEPADTAFSEQDLRSWAARLQERGALVENDCKSIHSGWISPSCISCRKGVGTETFLSSTQCPRNCWFCFNPNQADYEYYRHHVHDMASELQQRYDSGVRHTDLAVTGGEPLLQERPPGNARRILSLHGAPPFMRANHPAQRAHGQGSGCTHVGKRYLLHPLITVKKSIRNTRVYLKR